MIDHQAKLVQARVSEQAFAAIDRDCNDRGVSKADVVRSIIYAHYGLTLAKETP